MKAIITFFITLFFIIQQPTDCFASSKIMVGVVGSAPFVLKNNNKLTGLSVDLWKVVAKENDIDYTMSYEGVNVDNALKKLSYGKFDVLVGPVSITSRRAENVLFTQPYYHAGLSILAPTNETFASKVWFITKEFSKGLLILILVLSIVGTLVWSVERKQNHEQFPKEAKKGIATGIWFALVTMTTDGYGDCVPKSFFGRFVTGIWMLCSLVTISSLTAFLTTTQLETHSIENIEQLKGRRVAVISHTPADAFVRSKGCRPVQVSSTNVALKLTTDNQVAAFVHDDPVLSYLIKENNTNHVSVSKQSYNVQGYGFAVLNDTTLQNRLSVSILHAIEEKNVVDIEQKWLL